MSAMANLALEVDEFEAFQDDHMEKTGLEVVLFDICDLMSDPHSFVISARALSKFYGNNYWLDSKDYQQFVMQCAAQ